MAEYIFLTEFFAYNANLISLTKGQLLHSFMDLLDKHITQPTGVLEKEISALVAFEDRKH